MSYCKLLLLSIIFTVALNGASNLKPEDVQGSWKLRYKDGFGYEFRLKEGYLAYIAVYIKGQLLVFKGVYNIDDGNILRVNISEMKEISNPSAIENRNGFVQTSSSVFRFKIISKSEKSLIIEPKDIRIDGRSSGGYFEPRIELKSLK
ncbi:MAG: hypothetical protein JXK07_06835 [Spirochaetes bacterium]|nr:hypothetical protein [Spirochaetota bacterium]MBN2770095.1 hypothetical protein [Spirochaetota bacterium]HRX15720.1 hypothetical protein [Spirochaetota bacterium]